jgi:hypothetical protein
VATEEIISAFCTARDHDRGSYPATAGILSLGTGIRGAHGRTEVTRREHVGEAAQKPLNQALALWPPLQAQTLLATAIRKKPSRFCRMQIDSLRSRMRLIVDLQDMLHRELGIPLCGGQAFMAEQFLNRTQVSAFLQHVRAKGVAQRVRMHIG